MKIEIGILELSTYDYKGVTAYNVIDNLFSLLEFAENELPMVTSLWLGEHYSTNSSWSNPITLIPLLIASSKRLLIGPAGFLIKRHSIMDLLLNMNLLNAIFPYQLEVGLAGGDIPQILSNFFPKSHSYNFKLLQLNNFLNNRQSDFTHFFPFSHIQSDRFWILGNGKLDKIKMANKFNYNYCCSLLHENVNGELLKDNFSYYLRNKAENQKLAIAIGILCSNNQEIISKAHDILKTAGFTNAIIGSKKYIEERLNRLLKYYLLDRIVVMIPTFSFSAKKQTLIVLNHFIDGYNLKES